jgi:hypothetical protein
MSVNVNWGDPRLPPKFWLRVVPKRECWLWTGATNDQGYGQVRWAGRTQYTHRVTYNTLVGAIILPHLDHLCKVVACCRPLHLEPVSVSENIRRGYGNLCKRGHDLNDPRHGYVRKTGGRYCKTCNVMVTKARLKAEADARCDYAK